jgi:hypothetical protein
MHEIRVTPRLYAKLRSNEKVLHELGIIVAEGESRSENRTIHFGDVATFTMFVSSVSGYTLKDLVKDDNFMSKLKELFTDAEITTLNLK